MKLTALLKTCVCTTLFLVGLPIYAQNVVGDLIVGTEVLDGTGDAVAISGTGNRIVVGSDMEFINDTVKAGVVRVYEFNGDQWQQLGQDITGELNDDEVGNSVCMSSDGSRIAVGSSLGAKVYDFSGSVWQQVGGLMTLPAMESYTDIDGLRFSDDANTLLIAGNTRSVDIAIFELVGNEWVQKGSDFPEDLRTSMALSANGNRIAVVAKSSVPDINWEIRVFELQDNTWEIVGDSIRPPQGFWFAEGFDITGDGTRIVAALEDPENSGDAGVATYDLTDDVWVLDTALIELFVPTRWGTTLRLSRDGNTFVFGTAFDFSVVDQTYVVVYRFVGEEWMLLGDTLQGYAHDETAEGHVDITDDGSRIVMGGIRRTSEDSLGFAKVYDYSNVTGVDVYTEVASTTLYPNPAQDELHIVLDKLHGNTAIQLFNFNGQLVYKQSLSGTHNSIPLPETPGFYLLILETASGERTAYTVIKQE